MKNSILVIDGDASSRAELRRVLQEAGFNCLCTHDAEDARLKLEESRPILILLDWYHTSIPSLAFLAYIRRKVALMTIPVIMLSDRKIGKERVEALEAGADDFLDKPFVSGELHARIRALLRRVDNKLSADVLEVAGLRMELRDQVVYVGPTFTPLGIGRISFQLLIFLAANADSIFSRVELLRNVWGDDRSVNDRTVDVHIRLLRKVLAPSGHDKYIQTVRGCGYRFSQQLINATKNIAKPKVVQ